MTNRIRKVATTAAFGCLALFIGAASIAAKAEEPQANPSAIINAPQGADPSLPPPIVPSAEPSGPAAKAVPSPTASGEQATDGQVVAEEKKPETKKKKKRKKRRAPIVSLRDKEQITSFQRRHGLKQTGVVDKATSRELKKVNAATINSKEMRKKREKIYDGTVDQNTRPPIKDRVKTIPNRFVNIEIQESGAGSNKRYIMNFNGETLYYVNGQTSVIGVSETFNLGDEDAVILTTYDPISINGCYYKNHVLVLDPMGSKLLDIENCTREYQAYESHNSLYVEFYEPGIDRAIPAMWRLEGYSLKQL